MPHPYTNNSLIHCDIQALDKLEILTCVRESFVYMPGWTYESSAWCAEKEHPDARFFTFDLTQKTFMWWRKNDTFSDTQDTDEVIIKDMADISHLLQFVYDNAEEIRKNLSLEDAFAKLFNPPVGIVDSISLINPCGEQKKKRKEQSKPYGTVDLHMLYQKLKEVAEKNTVAFITAQQQKYKDYVEEPGIPVKYFYHDYAYSNTGGKSMLYEPTVKFKMQMKKEKDISFDKYDDYKYAISSPNISVTKLTSIIKELMGLHGPLAEDIRKLAKAKSDEIFKANEAKKQAEKDAKDAAKGVLNSWKSFQQAAQKKWDVNDDPYKDAVIKMIPYKKEDLKFYYTKKKTCSSDNSYTFHPKWYPEYMGTWDDDAKAGYDY